MGPLIWGVGKGKQIPVSKRMASDAENAEKKRGGGAKDVDSTAST